MKERVWEKVLPLCIVPSIFITDFFAKQYIENYGEAMDGRKILKKRIQLKKHHNTGIAMDLLEHRTDWIIAVSSIIFVGLCLSMAVIMPKRGKKMIKYGLAFLIGGAAGNIYDRMVRHYVVDYFSFQTGIQWLDRFIFNISDICILIGMLCIGIGDILK